MTGIAALKEKVNYNMSPDGMSIQEIMDHNTRVINEALLESAHVDTRRLPVIKVDGAIPVNVIDSRHVRQEDVIVFPRALAENRSDSI